jgi:hypothetical protein
MRRPAVVTFAAAFAAGVTLAVALGCASGVRPVSDAPGPAFVPEAAGPSAMRYVFAIGDDLARVEATVCFEGEAPDRLVPGVEWARDAFVEASRVDGAAADRGALVLDDRGISLAGVGRDACVRYALDLGRVAGRSFELELERHGRAVVTNTAAWLWRPPKYARCADVTARIHGPADGAVLVSWPPEGDGYRLSPRAFAFTAHAVFGTFARERVEAARAVFEIAVLDGLSAATRAAIVPWITAAARDGALPNGRFPIPRAQIVVIPSRTSARPVLFGHATRGGDASLAFVVAEDASRQALLADWVAVHEFSHLWWPRVEREDLWLNEGLATYYQEVLRARAGRIPATQAWSRFWTGAEQGRDATASLERESARVFETHEFSRVYWAGAALALMADIEIRRRSRGERSLDDVMIALGACCALDTRAWSARALIERMDAVIGAPVFAELFARHAAAPPFPRLEATFHKLGLVARGDTIAMRDDAPDAWIRDAIMAPAR